VGKHGVLHEVKLLSHHIR